MKWNIIQALTILIFTSAILIGCNAPWSPPPESFQQDHLVGTWETKYGNQRSDQLIIKPNGTFKQIYSEQDTNSGGYRFETPWNSWRLEESYDGQVRLHLQGGRYYPAGKRFAERDGREVCPDVRPDCERKNRAYSFYDPFSDKLVKMLDELILNVRITDSGELILHHNWLYGDRGFALIGGDDEIFHRVETKE